MFYELFPIFAVRRQKTKKGGSHSFHRTAPTLRYFQSLNISSRALSIATFRLFSMILNSSASNRDWRFFFFLSFSFWLLISPSPRLWSWLRRSRLLPRLPCGHHSLAASFCDKRIGLPTVCSRPSASSCSIRGCFYFEILNNSYYLTFLYKNWGGQIPLILSEICSIWIYGICYCKISDRVIVLANSLIS